MNRLTQQPPERPKLLDNTAIEDPQKLSYVSLAKAESEEGKESEQACSDPNNEELFKHLSYLSMLSKDV